MAEAKMHRITDRAIIRVIARRGAAVPPITTGFRLDVAPGEALVMRSGITGDALERDLAARLATIATVCDQSDAYALFALDEAALTPTTIRAALRRLVPVDPDAEPASPDQALATILHHLPVLLWREDSARIIAGPASARDSLAHAIAGALA